MGMGAFVGIDTRGYSNHDPVGASRVRHERVAMCKREKKMAQRRVQCRLSASSCIQPERESARRVQSWPVRRAHSLLSLVPKSPRRTKQTNSPCCSPLSAGSPIPLSPVRGTEPLPNAAPAPTRLDSLKIPPTSPDPSSPFPTLLPPRPSSLLPPSTSPPTSPPHRGRPTLPLPPTWLPPRSSCPCRAAPAE